MLEKPFACTECQPQPRENFSIFPTTDDWLIAYPDKRLIHIHFGRTNQLPDVGIAEGKFHWEWLLSVVQQYPDIRWFFMTDFSRKKGLYENVPSEAKAFYKKIRYHEKLDAGASYGMNLIFEMIMKLFMNQGGVKVALVKTAAEAAAVYDEWWKKINTTAN